MVFGLISELTLPRDSCFPAGTAIMRAAAAFVNDAGPAAQDYSTTASGTGDTPALPRSSGIRLVLMLVNVPSFHALTRPWRLAQKLQGGLYTRVVLETANRYPIGHRGPAVLRDKVVDHPFEGDAVQWVVRMHTRGGPRRPFYPFKIRHEQWKQLQRASSGSFAMSSPAKGWWFVRSFAGPLGELSASPSSAS